MGQSLKAWVEDVIVGGVKSPLAVVAWALLLLVTVALGVFALYSLAVHLPVALVVIPGFVVVWPGGWAR
jgi:hypothetical protein